MGRFYRSTGSLHSIPKIRCARACSWVCGREWRARTCTLVLLLLYFLYISGINTTVHPFLFQGISWKIHRACPRRRHRRQFWLCICLGSIGVGVESRGRAWCGTHPFRAQHVPNRVTRSRPVLNGVTTPTPCPATASPAGPGTQMNPMNRRFAPSKRRALLAPVDSRLVPNRTRPQRQARMGP